MKKFDINNSLSPELIYSAFINVDNEILKVIDMSKLSITLENKNGTEKIIYSNKDWQPIPLTDNWLSKFGLSESNLIRNNRTQTDWIIKKTNEEIFYITIKRDFSLGENPVIPLNSVHMLQLWHQLLNETYLNTDNVLK
ncbi:hypothetical protein [Confluentibacter flavum]|uniref:Uncharacterized protein n=1 Tax=Confluentibacter flavum TaxID=1909700 RepID=A0A2N3HPT5_9FLAO|nr:hypothetical protein [Confluentibacter flavum]PKQ46874.1 hypothetical protein CSW08_00755 [Confluentibacter flavum]